MNWLFFLLGSFYLFARLSGTTSKKKAWRSLMRTIRLFFFAVAKWTKLLKNSLIKVEEYKPATPDKWQVTAKSDRKNVGFECWDQASDFNGIARDESAPDRIKAFKSTGVKASKGDKYNIEKWDLLKSAGFKQFDELANFNGKKWNDLKKNAPAKWRSLQMVGFEKLKDVRRYGRYLNYQLLKKQPSDLRLSFGTESTSIEAKENLRCHGGKKNDYVKDRLHTTSVNKSQRLCTQIFVKTLSGKTITIPVTPSSSVDLINQIIFDREAVLPNQQRLIFEGRHLSNNFRLSELPDCATLHLIGRLRGGYDVWGTDQAGNHKKVEFRESDLFVDVCDQIVSILNMGEEEQHRLIVEIFEIYKQLRAEKEKEKADRMQQLEKDKDELEQLKKKLAKLSKKIETEEKEIKNLNNRQPLGNAVRIPEKNRNAMGVGTVSFDQDADIELVSESSSECSDLNAVYCRCAKKRNGRLCTSKGCNCRKHNVKCSDRCLCEGDCAHNLSMKPKKY